MPLDPAQVPEFPPQVFGIAQAFPVTGCHQALQPQVDAYNLVRGRIHRGRYIVAGEAHVPLAGFGAPNGDGLDGAPDLTAPPHLDGTATPDVQPTVRQLP